MHLVSNALMQVLIGSGIESVHGHWRTFLVHNLGVVGAGLGYWCFDTYKVST